MYKEESSIALKFSLDLSDFIRNLNVELHSENIPQIEYVIFVDNDQFFKGNLGCDDFKSPIIVKEMDYTKLFNRVKMNSIVVTSKAMYSLKKKVNEKYIFAPVDIFVYKKELVSLHYLNEYIFFKVKEYMYCHMKREKIKKKLLCSRGVIAFGEKKYTQAIRCLRQSLLVDDRKISLSVLNIAKGLLIKRRRDKFEVSIKTMENYESIVF